MSPESECFPFTIDTTGVFFFFFFFLFFYFLTEMSPLKVVYLFPLNSHKSEVMLSSNTLIGPVCQFLVDVTEFKIIQNTNVLEKRYFDVLTK